MGPDREHMLVFIITFKVNVQLLLGSPTDP